MDVRLVMLFGDSRVADHLCNSQPRYRVYVDSLDYMRLCRTFLPVCVGATGQKYVRASIVGINDDGTPRREPEGNAVKS